MKNHTESDPLNSTPRILKGESLRDEIFFHFKHFLKKREEKMTKHNKRSDEKSHFSFFLSTTGFGCVIVVKKFQSSGVPIDHRNRSQTGRPLMV
jgi:hypothetical protein